ncbi:glycosyltransferase family 2 protein [Alienimonas chondri]|uniref:Glycosyltransferase 2-like domain-containing protein n=1 Tax=Alienimonas chondri TaxID=2681879 RepID=A0ABX1VIR4_9PLAN|nr:glycosyltransferase [Alienimonas chondri]NNJ28018.1 hypothetical protein [Alienimonas chondri]
MPVVTVCIPHWQVEVYAKPCLRSLRKFLPSADPDVELEVIVVDNGSRDGSLDYLRSLSWIKLIERPEETSDNWPTNVFTAWDLAAREGKGEYLLTMHCDVFARRDGWLDPHLRTINQPVATGEPPIVASGAWKLELSSPLYQSWKRVTGAAIGRLKTALGRPGRNYTGREYPRDYCALYRREALVEHDLSFVPEGNLGGGLAVTQRIWAAGLDLATFPVSEMARSVVHVTHGTAAVTPDKPLRHARKQRQVERAVQKLFRAKWVRELSEDDSLDGPRAEQPAHRAAA